MGWDDEYLVTKEMITYNNHIHNNSRQFVYFVMLLIPPIIIPEIIALVHDCSKHVT